MWPHDPRSPSRGGGPEDTPGLPGQCLTLAVAAVREVQKIRVPEIFRQISPIKVPSASIYTGKVPVQEGKTAHVALLLPPIAHALLLGHVGRFILKIDGDGPVFSRRVGRCTPVSPLWHQVSSAEETRWG